MGTNPERTVWVGQIPEGATFKDLLALANQVRPAVWAEVLKKGTGAICFQSQEDAQVAAVALNGMTLNDARIEVDTWTKKPQSKGSGAKGTKGASWGGKGWHHDGSWGDSGWLGV